MCTRPGGKNGDFPWDQNESITERHEADITIIRQLLRLPDGGTMWVDQTSGVIVEPCP